MKKQLVKLGFFLALTIGLMSSCSSGTDTKAMDSLKSFYQEYIKASSKVPTDMAQITALQEKHCTNRLLNELANGELEADPFLNAQDVEEKWADNLEVAADGGANEYKVCYTASFDNAKHCVKVTMVEDGGAWKLDKLSY